MDASRKEELSSDIVCEYIRFAVKTLKWDGRLLLVRAINFEIENKWKGRICPPNQNASCRIPDLSAGASTTCQRSFVLAQFERTFWTHKTCRYWLS